jgi:uncharacterized protein
LNRLPLPDAGDLFFDTEGIPCASEKGIEYLPGFVDVSAGKPQYRDSRSLDKAIECRVFQEIIEFQNDRLANIPALHIYHYAPYEPVALKRLAMSHWMLTSSNTGNDC